MFSLIHADCNIFPNILTSVKSEVIFGGQRRKKNIFSRKCEGRNKNKCNSIKFTSYIFMLAFHFGIPVQRTRKYYYVSNYRMGATEFRVLTKHA